MEKILFRCIESVELNRELYRVRMLCAVLSVAGAMQRRVVEYAQEKTTSTIPKGYSPAK